MYPLWCLALPKSLAPAESSGEKSFSSTVVLYLRCCYTEASRSRLGNTFKRKGEVLEKLGGVDGTTEV